MEEQKLKKQANIRKVVISVLLVVALYFGGKKVVFSITHETTDNAQIETSIVPVLTRIGGYVKTIAIKDYDSVGQNQLVAEIDDAELQMQLEEQKADLQQSTAEVSNAKAQLDNAILSLKNNKGIIDLRNIKQKKSTNDLTRDQNLFKEQAITKKTIGRNGIPVVFCQSRVEQCTN
jgi:membrane fusion protein (multidrug efflux system)